MKKKLDFTGVETFQSLPEGTHVVKIKGVIDKTFQSGSEGFSVCFESVAGATKGYQAFDNFPIIDAALWKIKTLLEAVGVKAEGKIMLDTDKLVGKHLEIDTEMEEYNGKDRAVVKAMRKIIRSDEEEDQENADSLEELLEDSTFTDDLDEKQEEEPEEKEEKKEKPKKEKKGSKKAAKKEEKEEEDDEWDDEEDEWEDA